MDATHALRCNFVDAAAHNFDDTGSEIQPLIHPRYGRQPWRWLILGRTTGQNPRMRIVILGTFRNAV